MNSIMRRIFGPFPEGATVVITDVLDDQGERTAGEIGCDYLHLDVTSEEGAPAYGSGNPSFRTKANARADPAHLTGGSKPASRRYGPRTRRAATP